MSPTVLRFILRQSMQLSLRAARSDWCRHPILRAIFDSFYTRWRWSYDELILGPLRLFWK
ncbi:hypothetical protein A5666_17700 [Mycolicibacterium fortuitum]|nr:hypothetical protein A5665_03430 [Mycolicibacterium fortuitum]OBI59435.1 hypothetical protein A5666_17700 [Mycolicibacterium fortuitum]